MTTPPIKIFVPTADAFTTIAPGSAIVGRGETDGRVHVYFEGNLHGAINLERFIDRAAVAAGRLEQRYPTVAQAFMPAERLVEVGTFDCDLNRVTLTNEPALAAWLGRTDTLPDSFGPEDGI